MTFTPTDYGPYDSTNRRHICPPPAEIDERLKAVGMQTLNEPIG